LGSNFSSRTSLRRAAVYGANSEEGSVVLTLQQGLDAITRHFFQALHKLTVASTPTKSSPGSSAQDRTCELCKQCSDPGSSFDSCLRLFFVSFCCVWLLLPDPMPVKEAAFFGYWNSPAGHTMYLAVTISVSFLFSSHLTIIFVTNSNVEQGMLARYIRFLNIKEFRFGFEH